MTYMYTMKYRYIPLFLSNYPPWSIHLGCREIAGSIHDWVIQKTTILQQTTLETCRRKYRNSLYVLFLLKNVENLVAKGKIARFVQVLLLSKCFLKSSAAEA